MTKQQMVELRGEIFGLKILLMNTLAQVVSVMPDAVARLDELQRQAAEGIARTQPTNIPLAWLRDFQNAAAGVVVQAVEAAKVPHGLVPPPGRRQ